MFKKSPNIFAHVSGLENGNLVLHDTIIVKDNNTYNIKSRECPHRGYLMHSPGDIVKNVSCKLHGFAWNNSGQPLSKEAHCDHFYKLHHYGEASVGITGLLFQNFEEPKDEKWVKILSEEKDLTYSHSITLTSKGSRLWFMEQMTDLLHVRQNGIHPRQSLETPIDSLSVNYGNGWAMQSYPTCYGKTGFWLFVYPGFNIEHEPGKLLVARITPNDNNNEYGFTIVIQFYYSPYVDSVEKADWEKCIEVYKEDIAAIENINRPYFPLKRTVNEKENLIKHWSDWYMENKIK
jgi:hypothetical protein